MSCAYDEQKTFHFQCMSKIIYVEIEQNEIVHRNFNIIFCTSEKIGSICKMMENAGKRANTKFRVKNKLKKYFLTTFRKALSIKRTFAEFLILDAYISKAKQNKEK